MKMNERDFREYLLIYGADVHQWPEDIRQAGLDVLESSADLQALKTEQAEFERVIKTRKYEEPASDLARRIVDASLRTERKPSFSLDVFFAELFGEFRLPLPSVAAMSAVIIALLVIGFAVGYLDPLGPVEPLHEKTDLRAFLYTGGELL